MQFFIQAGFIGWLAIFGVTGTLQADSVRVSGIDFPVEELKRVSPKEVEIALFGERVILLEEKLPNFIVLAYFSKKERISQLSIEQLKNFILQSYREDAILRCAEGLKALSEHALVKEYFLRATLSELKNLGAPARLYESLLESVDVIFGTANITAEIILETGLSDPGWVESLPRRYALVVGDQVWDVLVQRLEQALNDNTPEALEALFKFGTAFYLSGNQRTKLEEFKSQILKARLYAEHGDIESLAPILDAAGRDKELQNILAPLVIRALHEKAREFITLGNFSGALAVLAKTDIKRRSPTTLKLIVAALNGMQSDSLSGLEDLKIQLLLRSMAKKDDKVKEAYLRLLDHQIKGKLNNYDTQSADHFLEDLLELRPDPNAANDQLRVVFIETHLAHGHQVLAKNRLSEISTDLPLLTKSKLLLAGLYVDRVVLFGTLSILSVGLLVVLLRRMASNLPDAETEQGGSSQDGRINAHKAFMMQSINEKQNQEYIEALKLFGLKLGATLEEIKSSFRAAVKEIHPDANPGLEPVASERFVELTNAYEKLLKFEKKRSENNSNPEPDMEE